ncbi:core protein [Trichinella pseudospiralis]
MKLVIGKERAAVSEIEEQLRMTEELYRQIDVLQEEFEAGLDEEERALNSALFWMNTLGQWFSNISGLRPTVENVLLKI